jgi:hypothetical protein
MKDIGGERSLANLDLGGRHHARAQFKSIRKIRRAAILILRRQLLAEPRHGAIKVMQTKPVDAGNPEVLTPSDPLRDRSR